MNRTFVLLWGLFFGLKLGACSDSTTVMDVDLGLDGALDSGGALDLGSGADAGPVDAQLPTDPCGEDAPVGDPEITIGTGREAFEPVCRGDTMTWVAGMQGAFHLEGAIRIAPEVVAGLSAQERAEIVHEYRVVDAQTAGEATDRELIDDGELPTPRFAPGPAGSLETFNVFLVIDAGWQGPNPDPGFASGRTLRYEVFVTLPDGTRYTQSVEVQNTCCS